MPDSPSTASGPGGCSGGREDDVWRCGCRRLGKDRRLRLDMIPCARTDTPVSSFSGRPLQTSSPQQRNFLLWREIFNRSAGSAGILRRNCWFAPFSPAWHGRATCVLSVLRRCAGEAHASAGEVCSGGAREQLLPCGGDHGTRGFQHSEVYRMGEKDWVGGQNSAARHLEQALQSRVMGASAHAPVPDAARKGGSTTWCFM